MKRIKKILCPVDFSKGSRAAVDYAHGLAQTLGANVELLHVWHLTYHVRPDLSVWAETHGQRPILEVVQADAEADLREFVEGLPDELRSQLETHCLQGEPALTIAKVAEEGAFDLIVLGTHGRTGVSHVALGSVAERVVRHAKCPVLTVRMPKK